MTNRTLTLASLFVFLLVGSVFAAIFYDGYRSSAYTPLQDPFSLKGKTEVDIESVYGKPESERVWFDGVTPMKKYRLGRNAFIEVYYSAGLAKGVYFEIPVQFQSKDLYPSLPICGINNPPPEVESQPDRVYWSVKLPDHSEALLSVNKLGDTVISCDVDF